MKKPIKISGYVLKYGEEIEPGTIISKDCKINLPKRNVLMNHNFDHYKIIGDGNFVIDENGVKYEGEVFIFEMAVGGVVKKREGNIIQEFDIKSVSIIPKINK